MNRYALIVNGVVANVTDADTAPVGWIACGNAGPGWLFDGTVFSKPEPTAARRLLTNYAFKQRFTPVERKRIRAEAKVNADIEDFMDLADSASYIDLDDPITRANLQALEAANLLDAPGRALDVMDAPVQSNEVWHG